MSTLREASNFSSKEEGTHSGEALLEVAALSLVRTRFFLCTVWMFFYCSVHLLKHVIKSLVELVFVSLLGLCIYVIMNLKVQLCQHIHLCLCVCVCGAFQTCVYMPVTTTVDKNTFVSCSRLVSALEQRQCFAMLLA